MDCWEALLYFIDRKDCFILIFLQERLSNKLRSNNSFKPQCVTLILLKSVQYFIELSSCFWPGSRRSCLSFCKVINIEWTPTSSTVNSIYIQITPLGALIIISWSFSLNYVANFSLTPQLHDEQSVCWIRFAQNNFQTPLRNIIFPRCVCKKH